MPRRKRLSPDQVQKALRDSAEMKKIQDATPSRETLAGELGPFKTCKETTFTRDEKGHEVLKITSEKATPEENMRRFGVYIRETSEKRALEIERSQRRNAEEGEVKFHDVRTGEVHAITPSREDHIARKSMYRPGARRRVFIGFGKARSD